MRMNWDFLEFVSLNLERKAARSFSLSSTPLVNLVLFLERLMVMRSRSFRAFSCSFRSKEMVFRVVSV